MLQSIQGLFISVPESRANISNISKAKCEVYQTKDECLKDPD